MGVAYYPVLKPAIKGYKPELAVGGKRIARAIATLDKWARELGVNTLTSFYSESLEEVFSNLGDEVPADMEEIAIEWSKPSEGLRTVRALISRLSPLGVDNVKVKSSPKQRKSEIMVAQDVADDLRSLESVLVKAQSKGSKFRLRIDI